MAKIAISTLHSYRSRINAKYEGSSVDLPDKWFEY